MAGREKIVYHNEVAEYYEYAKMERLFGDKILHRIDIKDRDAFIAELINAIEAKMKRLKIKKLDSKIVILKSITITDNKSLCDEAIANLDDMFISICKNPAIYTIIHEFAHFIHYFELLGISVYDDPPKKRKRHGLTYTINYHGSSFKANLKIIRAIIMRQKKFKQYLVCTGNY